MKRLIFAMLAAAAILLPAVSANAFSDITDPVMEREVAVLQTMGVVNGMTETEFAPDKTLTRAQFCKMAVLLKGDGEKVALYRSRTIFPDVRAGHWAGGYINLAVSTSIGAAEDGTGGVRLIRGLSDGTFRPDRPITYAEAVTILMRLLGYSDADAGMNWPQGYLTLAGHAGLTKGLDLSADQSLTRGQAAHLFYTALFAAQKGGAAYYSALGTATAGVVLMDDNATADDGSTGALRTSSGVCKVASGTVGTGFVGCRGILIVDEGGKAVVFLPQGEQETFTVRQIEAGESGAQAGWFTDQDGGKHLLASDTRVYTTEETTTYEKIWMGLRGGTPVTMFYNDAGQVDCLYVASEPEEKATIAVAYRGGKDLEPLVAGAGSYNVYRDGIAVSMSDVCQYDVGVYDAAAQLLTVSSRRLTGHYENARPNRQSPARIEILGAKLEVTEQAVGDLAAFELGDRITVLLTPDGRVAGVLDASELAEENIGILKELGDTAKITLLSGLEISGRCAFTPAQAGELVRVYSNDDGTIGINRIYNSDRTGDLNVSARTLGGAPLSPNCRFYDRFERSTPVQVDLEDLTQAVVPSSEIAYVHKTTGGMVDLVIFNNATGNVYLYGMVKILTKSENTGAVDSAGNAIHVQKTRYQICNQKYPDGYGSSDMSISAKRGEYLGIVFSADGSKILNVVRLTAQKYVRRSDFVTREGRLCVRIGSRQVQVSQNVQCYNASTGRWFNTLDEARAFSDNLTVYYDKQSEKSGQIRVVVAEKPID